MIKRLIPWIGILVLSLLTIRPLFTAGFFPMHDDAQVARVIVMSRALINGQFPVRLVADLGYGYGYPLFNFYGPLPYYVGAFFNLIGFDALSATKIMIGFGVVIGSVGMFILSSHVFGTFGGILSAILFTYFPYRAIQIYVRGAIGEMWAVSFLPMVIFGIFLLSYKDKQRTGVFIAGFSLAGIILSHTVFGYVITGSILVLAVTAFLVSFSEKKKAIRTTVGPLIGIFIFALGLTAFFWLPALKEMFYTNVEKVIGNSADYKDHFICVSQLWNSPWGFGGSASGCVDGMSLKLGKFHILLFIVSFLVWIFSREKNKRINGIVIGMFSFGVLSILFTLQISETVWKSIPYFLFIQYPWRFLGPAGVCMAFVSGYVLHNKKTTFSILSILILGGGILLVNMKLFSAQYLYSTKSESFGSVEALRWNASKLSDEYLPKGIQIPENASQVIRDRVTGNEFTSVKKIFETETKGRYEIIAYRNQELKLNMAYFPGWKYLINSHEIVPNVVQGQPYVILSSGNSLLEMSFSDTGVRKTGNAISIITILGMTILLCVYGQKTFRNHRHTGIQ